MYSFKRMNIEHTKGRLLVTSDIHGHIEHLKAVLQKARFDGDDLLLIVGDMLDKGPKSLETLRYVMKLCAEGRALVTMGNVDYLRLTSIKYTIDNPENAQNFLDYINYMNEWKGTCFYKELFNEIGIEPSSTEAITENIVAVWEHFKEEFDFIKSLPTLAESEKYIFVHGGIPHDESELQSECKDAMKYLKSDAFRDSALRKGFRFDRQVVCGHWPVLNYGERLCCSPLFDSATRTISIDGGCGLVREGQLNLLIFPSVDCEVEDIEYIWYDGFPTVTALQEQEESKDAFSISWPENEVTLISLKGDVAEVEHNATGKRLLITADALWKDPSTLKNGDVSRIRQSTDFKLSVNADDTLSVICKTSVGLLAKKNGVVGWYFGKYE